MQKVKINAKGYQGLEVEVAEWTQEGAWVILNRAGIDLAPRRMFLVASALSHHQVPEVAEPEAELIFDRKNARENAATVKWLGEIRALATNVTVNAKEGGNVARTEMGVITGSIAGAKTHTLIYSVRTWSDEVEGTYAGTSTLSVWPACGTSRNAKGGGHYVNYIRNMGAEVTCAKCAKR